MATIKHITKRYNGTDWDILHPQTETSQIVDLLDNESKIKESWLPTSVFGGMQIIGTFNYGDGASGDQNFTATDLQELLFDGWISTKTYTAGDVVLYNGYSYEVNDPSNNVGQTPSGTTDNTQYWTYLGDVGKIDKKRGRYMIAASSGLYISMSAGFTLYPGEGEDPLEHSGTVTVQKGDWVVCVSDDGREFAIVNNTYNSASTSKAGIVMLSESLTSNSSYDVPTVGTFNKIRPEVSATEPTNKSSGKLWFDIS